MRSLLNLTWLEIKIFVREPLGVFGSVLMPVVLFLVLGRMLNGSVDTESARMAGVVAVDVPVLAAVLIALSAVLSLITIIAFYREWGILKRLRATPLRPHTILTAHVLVKLAFTVLTLGLLALSGRRFYPVDLDVPWGAFAVALVLSTTSVLSIGFLIASVVPTARFAQPIGTFVLYPMVAVCGLFIPIESLPPVLHVASRLMPLTYAVSLMKGVLLGDPWMAHVWDIAALAGFFAVFTAISARVFRWE